MTRTLTKNEYALSRMEYTHELENRLLCWDKLRVTNNVSGILRFVQYSISIVIFRLSKHKSELQNETEGKIHYEWKTTKQLKHYN